MQPGEGCTNVEHTAPKPEALAPPVLPPPAQVKKQPEEAIPVLRPPPEAQKQDLDKEGLDELIRFINGGEEDDKDARQSSKAAKRASQHLQLAP